LCQEHPHVPVRHECDDALALMGPSHREVARPSLVAEGDLAGAVGPLVSRPVVKNWVFGRLVDDGAAIVGTGGEQSTRESIPRLTPPKGSEQILLI